MAGTGVHGVLLSTDGGATWTVNEDGATIYAVALDPTDPQRMAAAGYETGLLLSTDGGTRWRKQSLDMAATALHALAFDPDHAGRLWLGTVGDGRLRHGRSRADVGGRGATRNHDLRLRLRHLMTSALDRPLFRDPTGSTYAERCAALVEYYADREQQGGERPALGYIEVAARLASDRPLDEILPLLSRLLDDPTGDMFWMYPMAFVHHVGQGRLPEDVLARMRGAVAHLHALPGRHGEPLAAVLRRALPPRAALPRRSCRDVVQRPERAGKSRRSRRVHRPLDRADDDARAGRVRLAPLPPVLPRTPGHALWLRVGPGDAEAGRDDDGLPHRRLRRGHARRAVCRRVQPDLPRADAGAVAQREHHLRVAALRERPVSGRPPSTSCSRAPGTGRTASPRFSR